MDSPYLNELKIAFETIQQAAKLSQFVLSQAEKDDAHDLGVVSKDDLSPVTIADFAIQALLTSTLHAHFPSDRFVGEESAGQLRANPVLLDRVQAALQHIQSQVQDDAESLVRFPSSPEEMCEMIDWCGSGTPDVGGRIWVFDPIDGTENFVKNLVYAINVGLLEDGRQVLSAVGCPNLSMDVKSPASDSSLDPAGEGSIAFAVRGYGAFIRKLSGLNYSTAIRRLPRHAEKATDLRSVTCLNTSGVPAVHESAARQLGIDFPGSVLLPWVIRYVLLALDVGNTTFWTYQSRSRLAKIWDHAGAMLLFEEVGGKVTDVDGKDINWSAGRQMVGNYGIVAAPGNLHGHVLATVRGALKELKPELLLAPN
ncbi:putative 3bisphosphate nucleotidase [Diaporthe ampelina]|uniref:Putative 3bisphosphate nucleotidase n=1 Tax=Diaporthe ampelina TaxID=1214573 RepID=A0A0G2HMK0_9PEZI|nr:putative 3bisphosphate nucleotidase [Diaporthe ampelina]